MLQSWPRLSSGVVRCCVPAGLLIVCLLFYYNSDNNNSYYNGDFLQEKIPFKDGMKEMPTPKQRKLLRIALTSTMYGSVPPKLYGGTERIVSYLTEELVRRGHNVTLFASNDSITSAKLVAKWPSYRDNPVPDPAVPFTWMMNQVRAHVAEFDILHFHTDLWGIEIADQIYKENKSALVYTMHGLLSWYPVLGTQYAHLPHISISYDQRKHLIPGPKFIANVYHGIPTDLYSFVEKPAEKRYLAFLGKMINDKAPDWAIDIAVGAGIPLKMAAKADGDYWLTKIRPMIQKHQDLIEFVGEINDTDKNEFLGNAYAFLFPINWPEPFGMVMIEAMACGTPVIARRSGSVPEVIDEGITGLLFDTVEEAVQAVRKIGDFDRAKVRRRFEHRFSVQNMTDNYERVYHQMLGIDDEEEELPIGKACQ